MYFIIIYRTIILYVFILICYRIMGKKEVGELNIIDLIVSFSIAELASISIEATDKSIFTSIIPISILVILEIVLSFLEMKSDKIKTITEGNPELVIKNGKINMSIMKKLRYTLDDLLTQLRKKNIVSLEKIKYATLETDGTLSTTDEYPLPIIMDGKINAQALKDIRKNKAWVYNLLDSNNLYLHDIFYAFYSSKGTYIITYKDLN